MDFNKLPLWTAFAFVSFASLLFLSSPDYTINYLLGYNIVMWVFCGSIYAGEFLYLRLRKKPLLA